MIDTIRIAVLHPLLCQPIGDEGNAIVLSWRARRRGLPVEVIEAHDDGPLPEASVYLLGGMPTRDQPELARQLRRGDLAGRLAAGAAVLAVDAGFEVLGEWFEDAGGARHDGVGLAGFRVERIPEATGPVVTHPGGPLSLPVMSAFEARSGRVDRDGDVEALVGIEVGSGLEDGPRADGLVASRLIGTHLHGPVLARNPELADRILEWAAGSPLDPLEPGPEERLREQRIAEDRRDPTGWGGRVYGPPTLRSALSGRRRHR